MEDGAQLLTLPATLEPISRPSSTSTQASLAQLPGIAALATGGSAANSPQLRATNLNPQPAPPPPAMASGSSPSATVAGSSGSLPTCQNCTTSTTPLWRRDEMGSVLCNACGLFLKLHGRPRPISLKTDVIKSRNRVKTSMRPDMAMKKKQQQQAVPVSTDVNGADLQSQANAAAAVLQARRTSQKSANGHVEGADSPVSRTATPNMYNPHLPGYPGMDDTQYQAQTLAGFAVAGASPGRATSPLNGERLDVPQTQEQLIAANSSLKTRVSELEVINDFMQRRLAVFEYGGAHEGQEAGNQTDAQLRAQLEQSQQSEAQFKIQMEQAQMSDATAKAQLEESHRRENMLKRRLDELETELKDAKAALEAYESGRAKKPRLTDMINDPDEPAPRAEE